MIRSCRFTRLTACSAANIVRQAARTSSYHTSPFSQKSLLCAAKICRDTKIPRVPASAKFSASARCLRPTGTVDQELVAKIEAELSVEKQINENEEVPQSIKEYLDQGIFTLNDKAGQEEVELVRNFGDETIRVLFSVSDLGGMEEKMDDNALYDDEDAEGNTSQQIESEGKRDKARTESTSQAATSQGEEDQEEFDEDAETAFPVRLNVTIEKPNQGALQIETVAQDGMILIENVHFHKSAQLATAQTAEAEYERRGNYVGPPFGNLDEDLQMLLEKYLDERGINSYLALFVPEYIDYKEQKEYIAWLENVKNFVQS